MGSSSSKAPGIEQTLPLIADKSWCTTSEMDPAFSFPLYKVAPELRHFFVSHFIPLTHKECVFKLTWSLINQHTGQIGFALLFLNRQNIF